MYLKAHYTFVCLTSQRACFSGLTVAEHFRDAEGQDVLLFIDNIFRFTQVHLPLQRCLFLFSCCNNSPAAFLAIPCFCVNTELLVFHWIVHQFQHHGLHPETEMCVVAG